MLVLSRKVGQEIRVDGPCVIHVYRIGGGVVKLGIQADPDIRILRGEFEAERVFDPLELAEAYDEENEFAVVGGES